MLEPTRYRVVVLTSCHFVDRVLDIRSHTIHELTLNSTNQHEIRFFVQT